MLLSKAQQHQQQDGAQCINPSSPMLKEFLLKDQIFVAPG
jgi:hypothetical protein